MDGNTRLDRRHGPARGNGAARGRALHRRRDEQPVFVGRHDVDGPGDRRRGATAAGCVCYHGDRPAFHGRNCHRAGRARCVGHSRRRDVGQQRAAHPHRGRRGRSNHGPRAVGQVHRAGIQTAQHLGRERGSADSMQRVDHRKGIGLDRVRIASDHCFHRAGRAFPFLDRRAQHSARACGGIDRDESGNQRTDSGLDRPYQLAACGVLQRGIFPRPLHSLRAARHRAGKQHVLCARFAARRMVRNLDGLGGADVCHPHRAGAGAACVGPG